MRLSEIIEEIDEKYPNALSVSSKARKTDNLQKRLFRKYKLTVATAYEVLVDQHLYPVNIPASMIRKVLVNGKEYPYRRLEEIGLSKYVYFYEGAIGIYPTPTEDGEMLVYHYSTPATLSENNLNATPDLEEDYHLLLVYGVCKEIAENYREFDLVNGFMAQFNPMLKDMLEENEDLEPAQIQEEVWW